MTGTDGWLKGSQTATIHIRLHRTIVGSMLGHRLRRWPSIKSTLVQCLMIAEIRERAQHQSGDIRYDFRGGSR